MTTYEHETPQEALARYPGGMALRALHMLIFAILFGLAATGLDGLFEKAQPVTGAVWRSDGRLVA